jgi:hypothetical protein
MIPGERLKTERAAHERTVRVRQRSRGTYSPGRSVRVVIKEKQALRVHGRIHRAIQSPTPRHRELPKNTMAVPKVHGKDQKGGCEGPIVKQELINSEPASPSVYKFIFAATPASSKYTLVS